MARHAGKHSVAHAGGRLRRGWSVLGVLALGLAGAIIPATSASAASWGIQKVETSTGPYQPGQTVTWVVTVSCSDPNEDPCVPTTMTDPLPDYVELVSASIQSPGAGTVNPAIDVDTDTDTVTYTADSVDNGQQSQILITAVIADDIPYSMNGEPITNTATVDSDNSEPNSATDDIVPEVPLVLDSETTKSIEPDGAIASPGTPATMTIGGTNTSNDPVDSLVIVEPTEGTDPNPFTYLGFTGWGDVVWPDGAESATVTFTCADGPAEPQTTTTPDTLPDPPADCDVEGFTVQFDGDIAIGASASIPIDVEQTDAVTDLTDTTTITNTTSSNVIHGDDESDPTDASDTYVITPPNNSVTPTKTFDPAVVSAGDPTTVTLGATNDGDPTTEMTITEPSPGTDSPFEGDDPLTFTGWGTDGAGAGVVWPNDADAASVTFTCADGTTTDPIPAEAEDTLPDPPAGCEVVGFSVEYTGNIVTGAEATIPFTADTDPDQDEDNVLHPNEITAEIPNDSETAEDTLETLTDRLATETTKSISPSTIPALPGQTVVIGLPTQLLPFGEDGSTTNADQIVVQDPTDPSNPGEFWDNFVPTSVRSTDVPAGTTLTINYWNGSEWVEAPGCGPTDGAATVNCDLPADAQGVQFVYDDNTGEGIPPGTSVSPNFIAAYTGPEDADDPIENCGASSASSGTVAPTDPVEGCDTVDPFPVPVGPGDLDFMDKTFLAPDGQTGEPYTLRARTQDEITAQITWSTNGFENVDPMVISDIADPVAADDPAIADSYYDAFNLTRVEAIDGSVDPLIQYDQIESVELFIDGAWVEASGDPCPTACDGTFPGYTLTADEQESATSVRLTYTESPSRAQFPADPTVPAQGDGVARSTQADGRHLDLTFQLRDDRRSGGPALGRDQGEIYNNPDDPGLVTNTARGTATFNPPDGGDPVTRTDTDADDVLIIDEPINVGIDKEWTGGPLSVPPEGTPYEDFPTTNVTITGSNNSVARVDQLLIAEPSYANDDNVVEPLVAPGTNPFDAFTLTDIIDVVPPDGTETTTVTLTTVDGTTTDYDEAGAEALTVDDLADVIGVEVAFDGRIASTESGNNQGVLEMTLKLREFDRYTGDRITVDHDPNPVPNSAGAQVSDPGGTTADDPVAWDTADVELRDAEITMEETKSFTPATITEPGSDAETNPTSVLEITGQPTGPSRAVEMTLTDVDGSFWNQYDFVDFADTTFTGPIDQVQVDACTGGTYDEASDTFDGCTWTNGVPSGAFALPDGVDAADVVGLRFTFTKADGSIWENPANPTQVVHLTVQVRDTLRSDPDTLVPTDLEANDPAPGEDAPGVATNDVTATVTGADLVFNPDDPANPIPVTSDAEASGTINYEHAENGVKIVKDFNSDIQDGTEPPGTAFPMNITVTNVGNRPIYDPVIIDDPMPTDPDGPQLRLADVAEPYSYALTEPGTAPPGQPNGPQMPTDPDDVTVDRDGNIAGLTFTFPEGTVLEVGQVYTITVQVIFRTTLPANTVVNNTAGVTGDRPWDVCQAQSGEDGTTIPGRINEETGACEADADVTPIPSGVLAESKYVKATDDQYPLGFIVDPGQPPPGGVGAEDCEPVEPAGDPEFYAYPCTPVIPPGHDETWRIRVDNVGNLPMDKVVIYDRMPTPGDTASDPTSSSARGSQWEPILNPNFPPEVVDAPAGSTTTFYYTLVDDYCAEDLTDPVDEPVCSDDPTAGGWAELTPDTPDETYEEITAFKAVITMADGNLFRPGSSLALEGTTTTPPEVPEAGDRSIAFNSAAASGVVVTQAGDRINSLSAEGTKVGVATASGPLEVNKLVTGDGAQYAPDSFELNVQCTSGVGTWVEEELDPIPITVVPGTPTIVPNLPYGAECTITEDADAGQSELIVGTVTIDSEDPEDPTTITAINRYDLSSIVIDKEVVSDAVDQDGEPIVFGPFDGTVECTFLGEPVYADGYGPDDPMTFELDDGDSVEFDGLPVGSECTVTETGAGNASSTTITVQHGPLGEPVVTDGVSADLTLAGDIVGQPRNAVTLTNTFDVGSMQLLKEVTGDGADFATGPYTFEVVCTFDGDGAGGSDPQTVYEDSLSLGGDDPLDATIDNLPIGAECVVTETDDGGATSTDIDPETVVIGGDDGTQDPVEVTATNTFDVGSIAVDKVVDGDGAQYGTGPYEVTLECTFQGEPIEIPGGATRELTPGDPATFDGLPIGAECAVTESDDGGATSVAIDPENVTVGGDDGTETEVGVTVTNTYDLGSLQVEKDLAGLGALYGPGPFEVQLACSFEGEAIDPIPGGATRSINAGETITYDDLPVGAECTVTETNDFGASSVEMDPVGEDPEEPATSGTVTVGTTDDDPVLVTVTNTFLTSPVVVRKVVDGDGAEFAPPMPDFEPFPGLPDPLPTTPEDILAALQDVQEWLAQVPFDEFPYQVSMACTTSEGEEVTIPGGETRRFGPGFPGLYFGIPDGATCTVTETDEGGATSVAVAPDDVVVDGSAPITEPQAFTVTNTYDVGEFTVEKAVDGDGAEAYGDGPFEVTAVCTFEGNDIEVPGGATRAVSPDEPAVYSGLPVGADCVVSESDDGGATSSTITTAVEDGDPGEVVVPASDAEQVSLLLTNTFDLGELTVDKVVDGDGAEAWGSGPFEVTLSCTFDGEDIEIPGGATQTITGGESVTYTDLPVGAECVVTESEAAGATTTTISTTVDGGDPGQVVVPGADADPAVVTVTNTFDVGSLAVDKVVDFEGDAYDVGPFEVTLACTFQGEDIEIPGGAAREIAAGDTVTYAGLPIGAECVVTETDDGGAASSTVSTVGDGDPGAVTIAADPASLTVTNTFDPPPPPPGGDGDTGGGGWLPTTGADIALWVGLAVLLVAGGAILVGIRRRQQH
ncbi:DUF5979 domain-containing protein [Isoptericola sp. NPDC056134]|uniref:DUF5979 domain-containing protein n=1 Tax=Isoptericola sp. NPDC056134 TaxID=3345723 RepID=UPI0035E9E51F